MMHYGTDLAYVHDVGYDTFAKEAAQMIVHSFKEKGFEKGLIID
jgi:hypothetical protein